MNEAKNELAVVDPRNNALARQQAAGIITAVPSEDLKHAVVEYKRIQEALDASMPECIMRISGKQFRKKQYWRGVRMAFNLEVVAVGERRVEYGTDWGYEVTYRATAPNGSTADGDGACMASEKEVRDKNTGEIVAWKTKQAQTVHNVRSHAHTRAMNRAISNLVGFGEVSAEEFVDDDDSRDEQPRTQQTKQREQQPEQVVEATGFASRDDEDLFWSRAATYGAGDREKLREWLASKHQPAPEGMTYKKREELLELLGKNHAKKLAAAASSDAPVESTT